MKRIGHIYEKIIDVENCKLAILNASRKKRKRKEVQEILKNLDYYAQDLSERLQRLDFISPYYERTIKDGLSGKIRILHIPKFYPDQCAHHAVMLVLMPMIEQSSYYWSCANIPQRGIDRACKGTERATVRDIRHSKYCVKLDIHHFYPSIPHDKLKAALRRKIKDVRALEILYAIIDSHPDGIPIGNYTSPWFAELYLQPLDWYIKHELHIRHYIRYADDMVLIDSNKRKLHRAMDAIRLYCSDNLGLEIKDNYQLFRVQVQRKAGQKRGKGRKIDFVGRCFGLGFTTVRKRRALSFMRQSRLVQKYQRSGKPVRYRVAAGFMSRAACLRHTNSLGLKIKYYDTVKIKPLKEAIRYESKRQSLARCA